MNMENKTLKIVLGCLFCAAVTFAGKVTAGEKDAGILAACTSAAPEKQGVSPEGMETLNASFAALHSAASMLAKQGNISRAIMEYAKVLDLEGITTAGRINTLFEMARLHETEEEFIKARKVYDEIITDVHAGYASVLRAKIASGDTWRNERNYTRARLMYEEVFDASMSMVPVHEHFRTEAVDRLSLLEGLDDGDEEPCPAAERIAWINRPQTFLYVSDNDGCDSNDGTEANPVKTILRARDMIREMKSGGAFAETGITVYIRRGVYRIDEGLALDERDSGSARGPVVYRSYPGDDVRIAGGRKLSGFEPVSDPSILRRLPEKSRGSVLQVCLRSYGLEDYGILLPRGRHTRAGIYSPMELFFGKRPMELARWPDEGWARMAAEPSETRDVEGEICLHVPESAGGRKKFDISYSGDAPSRWQEEDEIWLYGYWLAPWGVWHMRVVSLDAENRKFWAGPLTRGITSMRPRPGGGFKDSPYFAYNVLAELSRPGEYYIDRNTGMLYFWPPGDIGSREAWVSTLKDPIVSLNNVSNVVFYGLTLEGTWNHGIDIQRGQNVLIAGCTIRNTGKYGIFIGSGRGWHDSVTGGTDHKTVGCDIYYTGEGGISLSGGNLETLEPSGHLVENCHIHHFNRLCGDYRPAIRMAGVGHRASHNLIHDTPHMALTYIGQKHIIEYNEFYDVVHVPRDMGAIYTYSATRPLSQQGVLIRYNLFHHITKHSSPHSRMGVEGIYLDDYNAGATVYGNTMYRLSCVVHQGGGRDNRFENNLIHECALGIIIANRGSRYRDAQKKRMTDFLESVNHTQPPWSERFPILAGILEEPEENWGVPLNNVIERNIMTDTIYGIRIDPRIRHITPVTENHLGGQHSFSDSAQMDFNPGRGSPVYLQVEFEPVPSAQKGLYDDVLRASRTAPRSEYGKYYDHEKFERLVAGREARIFGVKQREAEIVIDGVPEASEWGGLQKEDAMPIGGNDEEPPDSYVWALYDDEYLYVAFIASEPDPVMPEYTGESRFVVELSIEGGEQPWSMPGASLGPVYVMWGHSDGTLNVRNLYNLPDEAIAKVSETTRYATSVISEKAGTWSAEWRIPWDSLGIHPSRGTSTRFNIGVERGRRRRWYGWADTGGAFMELEYAGTLVLD